MDSNKTIDMGIAGSILMIILTTAVVILLTSFYRRYKRAAGKSDEGNTN